MKLRVILIKLLQLTAFIYFSTPLYAMTGNQSYQTWKEQQKQHDQKLKEWASTNDHYLGKPILNQKMDSSKKAITNNSGKIRINKASAQELQQLKGVGEKKAQAIVDYRQENGPFKTIQDLLKVKGLGTKFIENNQAILSL